MAILAMTICQAAVMCIAIRHGIRACMAESRLRPPAWITRLSRLLQEHLCLSNCCAQI